MIVVIQCASGKHDHAGHLRTRDGRNVLFVARHDAAPAGASRLHARPDDVSDTGATWRTVLQEYNAAPGANPLGLLPAWQLCRNPTYGILADRCGTDRLCILSAGRGLVRADFLTPSYDITFSRAEQFKRGDRRAVFEDFSLPPGLEDAIVFFGGRNCIPLFCRLTANARGRRTVFCSGGALGEDAAPGCTLRGYERQFTNWHYQCARHYAEGGLHG